MTIYDHERTWVEVDRETGLIRVHLKDTGEMLSELTISTPGISAPAPEPTDDE